MNKQNIFIFISLLIITIFFFTNNEILYYSVLDSFNLFFDKIYIPLFPFLILGNILINYNFPYYFSIIFGKFFSKLFNINKQNSFFIFLSMLVGFPSGAVYINKYLENNLIDEEEAVKLLSISFFPTPSFVISSVGVLFLGNIKYGIIILISLYITNFLLGIFIRNKSNNKGVLNNDIRNTKSFGIILKESILLSFNTLIIILGSITIFMIISNLIFYYLSFNPFIESIISSILEMTNGIKKISDLSLTILLKILFITFSLSFSGLSIHSQVLSILSKPPIYKKVFINRIFASILSIIISYIIYSLFLCIWKI